MNRAEADHHVLVLLGKLLLLFHVLPDDLEGVSLALLEVELENFEA